MLDPITLLELQRQLYDVADKITTNKDPIEQLDLMDKMNKILFEILGGISSLGLSNNTDSENKELLENYRSGKFNNETPDEFKLIMKKVSDAGMPLNEVGDGVLSWFNSNPEQLAA